MNLYIIILLISVLTFFLFKNFNRTAKKLGMIEHKNSHAFHPTPTGSGIIFMIMFVMGSIFIHYFSEYEINLPNKYVILFIGCIVMSLTGFKDDVKQIDPILRLILHFICIYFSLVCLPIDSVDLSIKLSIFVVLVAWIYIANITNFIDGTDGFLITHVIFFYANIFFLNFFTPDEFFSFFLSILILPTSIIFLYFNKPKAKLFMGDAGSIFFGYLIGFSFLEILIMGYWNIALSLLAYPLLDCTIGLIKKTRKGIMPWVGMYDYCYLKPVLDKKKNHIKVLILYTVFNILNFFIIQLQFSNELDSLFLLSYLMAFILMLIFQNHKRYKFFN